MTGMSASSRSPTVKILAIAAAAVAGCLAGAAPDPAAAAGAFTLCTQAAAERCVVDGDTIEVAGERIRMIDFDTPQIGEPKFGSERALGLKATLRLLELLNSGDVQLQAKGDRDVDK